MTTAQPADICMILEGTYPYVAGGVSTWVHDMLQTHADRSFHLVSLLPDRKDRQPRYTLPGNVVGLDHVYLQDIAPGSRPMPGDHRLFRRMEHGITALMEAGHLEDLAQLDDLIRRCLHRSTGHHVPIGVTQHNLGKVTTIEDGVHHGLNHRQIILPQRFRE